MIVLSCGIIRSSMSRAMSRKPGSFSWLVCSSVRQTLQELAASGKAPCNGELLGPGIRIHPCRPADGADASQPEAGSLFRKGNVGRLSFRRWNGVLARDLQIGRRKVLFFPPPPGQVTSLSLSFVQGPCREAARRKRSPCRLFGFRKLSCHSQGRGSPRVCQRMMSPGGPIA